MELRTLIIYIEEIPKYIVLEGDYTKFHNLVIGGVEFDEILQSQFCDFFYDKNGGFVFDLSEDINIIENKEWDKVALITFLL